MLGIAFVLLATLFLAIQNVNIKLILSEQLLLGLWQTGGWLAATPGHALLLLHLRLLWAIPMLLFTLQLTYPKTLSDLKRLRFSDPNARPLLWRSIVSAVLLFVALSCLFIAINYLPTGIAIAVFFLHPAEILLLAWLCWGQRPTRLQFGVMVAITVGLWLMPGELGAELTQQWWLGIAAALGASVAIAAHSLMAQTCLIVQQPCRATPDADGMTRLPPTLHPLSYSVVLFIIGVGCSSLCLPLLELQIEPQQWLTVIAMSSISGLTAMAAYVLLNLGIQRIGAAQTSLVSALTPALTAALAWLLLRESLTGLQLIGVLLISGAVMLLI